MGIFAGPVEQCQHYYYSGSTSLDYGLAQGSNTTVAGLITKISGFTLIEFRGMIYEFFAENGKMHRDSEKLNETG